MVGDQCLRGYCVRSCGVVFYATDDLCGEFIPRPSRYEILRIYNIIYMPT